MREREKPIFSVEGRRPAIGSILCKVILKPEVIAAPRRHYRPSRKVRRSSATGALGGGGLSLPGDTRSNNNALTCSRCRRDEVLSSQCTCADL